MTDSDAFIEATTEQAKALYRAYTTAEWEAAVSGTPEANRRNQEAQTASMRFWADPERYATARRLHESGAAADPVQARCLKVIYLEAAENQQDEAIIERLTALEAAVRARYYNSRGVVGGRPVSDNELDNLLAKSADREVVQEAWEASKTIGVEVAADVRELARVRNQAARAQGFRDHFQRSLALNEIEEDTLLELFERLDRATAELFAGLKADIDQERAARFRIPLEALRPWHYGDRFFQDAPDMGEVDLDVLFSDKDPVRLSEATYDGLSLEVRDILARSDLYARDGKNQHAFCIDIDREGDVRTLNNLEPNHRWNETLLHELGHAVYDKYLDPALPWLLRRPPHTLSTEAVAILMGSLTYDAEWLRQVAGVPAAEAEKLAWAAQAKGRALRLIFSRWVLVMTHFERALYGNPEADLDGLWWDLVERYQGLTRPAGRRSPDWAAKIHVALYPVYYHNYELGHLISAQLQHRLRHAAGGLTGRPAAGQWLVERIFRPGNREDWRRHVERATGEPLDPLYFVASLQPN